MPGIAIAITVLSAALSAWVGARLLAGGAWGRQPGVDESRRNLRKVHSNPTPRVGGIAVALGLIWGLLAAGVWQTSTPTRMRSEQIRLRMAVQRC